MRALEVAKVKGAAREHLEYCAPAKRCSAVPGGPREETRLPQNKIIKLPQCNH